MYGIIFQDVHITQKHWSYQSNKELGAYLQCVYTSVQCLNNVEWKLAVTDYTNYVPSMKCNHKQDKAQQLKFFLNWSNLSKIGGTYILYFQCVHSLCKICTILNENLLSYRLHKLDILLVFGMEGLTTQVKNTLDKV